MRLSMGLGNKRRDGFRVDAKLGMIWYPSIDDVIDVNIDCLDLTRDRHPHELRGSREGIQAIIDKVRRNENKGSHVKPLFS